MSNYYVRIDTDGTATPVPVTDSYTTLSEGVGGYIERVPCMSGHDVWVNEEGLLYGLPPNFRAMAFTNHEYLAGPAMVTKGCDSEGESLPFTKAEADAFCSNF